MFVVKKANVAKQILPESNDSPKGFNMNCQKNCIFNFVLPRKIKRELGWKALITFSVCHFACLGRGHFISRVTLKIIVKL